MVPPSVCRCLCPLSHLPLLEGGVACPPRAVQGLELPTVAERKVGPAGPARIWSVSCECGAPQPGKGPVPAQAKWNSLILLLEPQAHTGWGPQSSKYNDCLVHVPDVRLAASPVLTL